MASSTSEVEIIRVTQKGQATTPQCLHEKFGIETPGEVLVYEDENHFQEFLTETFLRLSHRLSFVVDWIDTFFPDVQKSR